MRFRSLPSLLAGLLVLAACSAPAPDTPPPPAVLVRSVDAAGAPPAVQVYAGEVRARIESDLGFRIGGKLENGKWGRGGATQSVRLGSGDVILFGGPARLAYHGIDRVVAGSSRLVPGGGRLSLTLRRVKQGFG